MSKNLLPCPFCGNDVMLHRIGFTESDVGYHIVCPCCDMRSEIYDTEQEVIDFWNCRVIPKIPYTPLSKRFLMTREEAIERIEAIKEYLTAGNPIWDNEVIEEACDLAIEALHMVSVGFDDYADRLWKVAHERGKRDALDGEGCE